MHMDVYYLPGIEINIVNFHKNNYTHIIYFQVRFHNNKDWNIFSIYLYIELKWLGWNINVYRPFYTISMLSRFHSCISYTFD